MRTAYFAMAAPLAQGSFRGMDENDERPGGGGSIPGWPAALDPATLPGEALLDDRNPPLFRQVFGHLLERADEVSVAIQRVRLSGVDLRAGEVSRLERLRVLTANVSAHRLRLEAETLSLDPARRGNLEVVRGLFREGRLVVRAAPLGGWAPDFSVFRSASRAFALLVGPHWFERPFPYRGPALGAVHGREAAKRMDSRFRELWEGAHEIGAPVLGLLEPAGSEASTTEVREAGPPLRGPVDRDEGPG